MCEHTQLKICAVRCWQRGVSLFVLLMVYYTARLTASGGKKTCSRMKTKNMVASDDVAPALTCCPALIGRDIDKKNLVASSDKKRGRMAARHSSLLSVVPNKKNQLLAAMHFASA